MASKRSTTTKHYTRPAGANTIRIGDVVLIQSHPCKIVEIEKSKTGKHGGMKVHFVGMDIFTNKKCIGLVGSQDNVTLCDICKDDYMLVDITDDGYLSFLDGTDTRADLKLPTGDLGDKIKTAFENDGQTVYITVLAAVNREEVIGTKNVYDK